jgi:hypothetical protein
MKKIKTLLMLMLMLLSIGCKQQKSGQDIEALGHDMMKKIEKDDFSRIQEMIVGMLKYPESYQPISTDMSIVTSDMIIYDSETFIALRRLSYAIENFNEMYDDNDVLPDSALQELDYMQYLADYVHKKIDAVNNRRVKFEGIDVYHQFYANDEPDSRLKRGYHFVVHKKGLITMHSSQEDFSRVQAFIKQCFDYPSYYDIKPDSIDKYINKNLERLHLDNDKKTRHKSSTEVKKQTERASKQDRAKAKDANASKIK